MAQPASSPKIDELRSRLRTEPNSRIFYPLAEELRKAGALEEAEQVLRGGLANHQTYLAAWVSLGRVLAEQKRSGEAIDPLSRALQIDPSNVVTAKLLGDCYLELGEKVEAIKKYKLAQALMPGDEEVEAVIERLDRELNPPDEVPAEEPAPAAGEAPPEAEEPPPAEALPAEAEQPPVSSAEAAVESAAPFDETLPLARAAEAVEHGQEVETATADAEPMLAAHDASPFEEPVAGYSAAAFEVEAPAGMHVGSAPLAAEVAAPAEEQPVSEVSAAAAGPEQAAADADVFGEPERGPLPLDEAMASIAAAQEQTLGQDEADVFAPAAEPFGAEEPAAAPQPQEDLTNTITMADLYVRQGLIDDARQIYQSLLMRDPGNAGVRARLESLTQTAAPAPASSAQKIARLEKWLAKVARKEVGRV